MQIIQLWGLDRRSCCSHRSDHHIIVIRRRHAQFFQGLLEIDLRFEHLGVLGPRLQTAVLLLAVESAPVEEFVLQSVLLLHCAICFSSTVLVRPLGGQLMRR